LSPTNARLSFGPRNPDPASGISAPTVSGHIITTTTRISLTNELPRRLLRCQIDLVAIISRQVLIG
jgi:hypothetical protein